MSIEENFKDVIPLFTNKRETYLRLNKTIPGRYEGRNSHPLLKKQIKEPEKLYSKYYFDYEYLSQYWL